MRKEEFGRNRLHYQIQKTVLNIRISYIKLLLCIYKDFIRVKLNFRIP